MADVSPTLYYVPHPSARPCERRFSVPTATLEEYLETIYKLADGGPVRPTRIAEYLGVSGPTVTATLKRLESRGLISRQGTSVVLTPEGTEQSLDIVRKHRVAERFLVDVLGLDWEAAHEDACLLEHAMSPRVLEALEAYLGDPTECPHGHPIPTADGRVDRPGSGSLAERAPGERVRVVRVAEDANVLSYLGEIGLRPGAVAEVMASEPFGGPLTITVGGTTRAIAREVACAVEVESL